MSTTVTFGSMEATSTSASAEEISAVLSEKDEKPDKPSVLVDKGEPVEEKPEPEKKGISKAASELGKRGGKAAAAARKDAEKAPQKAQEPEGDAPDDEDEPEDGAGEEDAPESRQADRRGNPRHDPSARVAQATRETREARERADRAEREVAELRAQMARPPQAAPPERREAAPERPDPLKEPDEGDFDSYKDYVKAVARHEYALAEHEGQVRQRAHAAASAHYHRAQTAIDGLAGAMAKANEADPDFTEYVRPLMDRLVPTWTLPPDAQHDVWNWVADELTSAPENAPALLRHLRERPDALQRVATLRSPRAVTRELATIYARLDAATAGTSSSRSVSQAKPPVRPVTGSPHTDTGELDDDAPLSAYVKRFGDRELKASRR